MHCGVVMNKPKTALCIHDLSGVGRCSLTVIMPALSAMGVQCCPLPTAILSSHFGGFGAVAMKDETDFMLQAKKHYDDIGLAFDCVYTGFLSSAEQVEHAMAFLKRDAAALKVVDPVMGDGGKPYRTITPEIVEGMKQLCAAADIITPNTTETQMLLGLETRAETFSEQGLLLRLEKLSIFGASVIITGAKLDDERVVCAVYDRDTKSSYLSPCHYVPASYPGTGDLFAAVLCGALLRGKTLVEACEIAARFVEHAVGITYENGGETRHGVWVEPALPKFGELL